MSAELATALSDFITYGLGPAFVVGVGWVLNRSQTKRAEEVKRTLEQAETKNSEQHSTVADTLSPLVDELRAFRSEFRSYREEHNREHRLLNDKINHY